MDKIVHTKSLVIKMMILPGNQPYLSTGARNIQLSCSNLCRCKAVVKPNVIYIGDSFLFEWLDEWVLQNTDSAWQIWYYNQSLINRDHSAGGKVYAG